MDRGLSTALRKGVAAAPLPLRPPQAPAAGWRRDLSWTLLALVAVLAWDASRLDLPLVRWYGSIDGFAWREHWLARDVVHTGGRGLAFVVLGMMALNAWRPLFRGLTQREAVLGLLLTLIGLVAVPMLKRYSLTSCPWSLAEFGGAAHYVSHWRPGVGDGGSGHCFPSGHATSAFAFFGGYFMLRRAQPLLARRWLAAVLLIGALFGWTQMARGAHYLSHSLWSAWLCWVIACLGAPRRTATGALDRHP